MCFSKKTDKMWPPPPNCLLLTGYWFLPLVCGRLLAWNGVARPMWAGWPAVWRIWQPSSVEPRHNVITCRDCHIMMWPSGPAPNKCWWMGACDAEDTWELPISYYRSPAVAFVSMHCIKLIQFTQIIDLTRICISCARGVFIIINYHITIRSHNTLFISLAPSWTHHTTAGWPRIRSQTLPCQWWHNDGFHPWIHRGHHHRGSWNWTRGGEKVGCRRGWWGYYQYLSVDWKGEENYIGCFCLFACLC